MSSTRCKSLLDWYAEHARDLPWRHTREPYRIWISEIMLQQTQVKTVLPRYQTWFEQFPDIATLASASLDDVLKAWEGLGYYRRARFIHQTARQIVAEHNGLFPVAFEAIMALPGIGRSTAGAIASFCFDERKAVLDGNVKRLFRRWHAQPEATDKTLWKMAQQSITTVSEPDRWNQAMMELGATICGAKSADCADCPVSEQCACAFRVDFAAEKRKRAVVHDLYWKVLLHICSQKGIWLVQRPESGIWAGLWTPPIIELRTAPKSAPAHIHLLTHRRLHLYPLISNGQPAGAGQWVRSIKRFALPTGIHRLLAKANYYLID